MNPYPFSLLNHFTVPVAISPHPPATLMNGQQRRNQNAINYSLETEPESSAQRPLKPPSSDLAARTPRPPTRPRTARPKRHIPRPPRPRPAFQADEMLAREGEHLAGRRLFTTDIGHLRPRQAHEIGCLQP